MTTGTRFLAAVAALSCLLLSNRAHAEAKNYELFRVDTGVTGAFISGTSGNGFGAVIEPKFNVHDRVTVGFRSEAAVMWGAKIDTGSDTVAVKVSATAALLGKAEYYFTEGSVRPFVGMGMGVYYIGGQSVGGAAISQKAGRYFGVAPQIGIELGVVRFAASYNAMLGADFEVSQTVGTIEQSAKISQNFLSIELSFRIGGGRKAGPPPHLMASR